MLSRVHGAIRQFLISIGDRVDQSGKNSTSEKQPKSRVLYLETTMIHPRKHDG